MWSKRCVIRRVRFSFSFDEAPPTPLLFPDPTFHKVNRCTRETTQIHVRYSIPFHCDLYAVSSPTGTWGYSRAVGPQESSALCFLYYLWYIRVRRCCWGSALHVIVREVRDGAEVCYTRVCGGGVDNNYPTLLLE